MILRRNITHNFNSESRYWMGNSPFLTHSMNALSSLFPQGERFFVDSVRYFRDRADQDLLEDIRGFIGQEAMHSREHEKMNEWSLDSESLGERLNLQLKSILDVAKKLPEHHQLAITCALEHITAMMADMLIERDDVREMMSEEMQELWTWHAVEEAEHKAVTYDLYSTIGGNYATRVAYLAASTAALFVVASAFTAQMMIEDRKNISFLDSMKGLNIFFGWRGAFSSLAIDWLSYMKPGFHPNDKSSSNAITKGKDLLGIKN